MPPFLQVMKPRLEAGKTFVQGHRAPRGSLFKPSPPRLQTPRTLSCCLHMGPPHFNHPAMSHTNLFSNSSGTQVPGESSLPVTSVKQQDRTPGHVGHDTEQGC